MHLVNVGLTSQLQRDWLVWLRLWSADYCYFLVEQVLALRSVTLRSVAMWPYGKARQSTPKGVKVDV